MITNTSVTVYHKGYDTETRTNTWTRYFYEYAWWFGGKGSSVNKGYENANDYDIRIPYNINENANISHFAIGDIILYGSGPESISSQQDLSGYEFCNITSINNNDFSTHENKHIHLGGK